MFSATTYEQSANAAIREEGFSVYCNSSSPCQDCKEEVKKFYCSCCDVPSRVNHITDDDTIITNNILHTCEECGHTAHWACHKGNSIMEPADVMELSRIRCVKCKSMINAKHSYVQYVTPQTKRNIDDACFTKNLLSSILESSNMKSGHFKNEKVEKTFGYIVDNIRAYDRIKTVHLEDVLNNKLNEFSHSWGYDKSDYFFSKIM